jgi:hypothetical protein
MSDDKFTELVIASHQYLSEAQDRLKEVFGIGTHDRYYWDEPNMVVEFSTADEPLVTATTRVVGSVSTMSGTWLWSWANSNLASRHWQDVLEVKRFGEAKGIWQLTTAKWEADEVDGWEMTSIAAHILRSQGAYRLPYPHTYYFVLLDNVRHVKVAV